MRSVEVTTDDLPARDRFPFWLDAVTTVMGPHEINSKYLADFRGRVRSVDLDGIRLGLFDLPPVDAQHHSGQPGEDVYHLAVPIRGLARIRQGREEAAVEPGQLLLYRGSAPFRSVLEAPPRGVLCRALLVSVPQRSMPGAEAWFGALGHRPVCGRTGVGRILRRHLIEVVAGAGELDNRSASALAVVTPDLIVTMLAVLAGADPGLGPPDRRRVLLAGVLDYIDRRLADPALSPVTIAAAQHMSTRSLHRLFEEQGMTVAQQIRLRRLQRCREDLVDPALRHRSVEWIARRRGFVSSAHFSRLFRAAHGLAPGAWRGIQLPEPMEPSDPGDGP